MMRMPMNRQRSFWSGFPRGISILILWLVLSSGCSGGDFSGYQYSISGTVTGSVQEGVTIALINESDEGISLTGSDGTYTFSNLPNGTYIVTASLGGYTFTPDNQSVTINDANVTSIDFISTEQ
jgi:hypothetical protein